MFSVSILGDLVPFMFSNSEKYYFGGYSCKI